MRHTFVLLGLLAFLTSCGHNQVKSQSLNHSKQDSAVPAATPNPLSELDNPKAPAPQDSHTLQLEPASTTKVTALFESLIQNDDKKAKLNYGRASRSLPELVQFAVDLHFRNYEHAQAVLSKTSMGDTQKDFWSKIIAGKPLKLSVAICKELKEKTSDMPAALNPQDIAWKNFFSTVVTNLVANSGKEGQITNTALDDKLALIQCHEKTSAPKASNCGALPEDVQKELLTESFFDKLHNMKRRDTRNAKQLSKSALKVALYEKRAYVKNLKDLLQFYHSVNATPIPKQTHFLRRFKGLGRDMRIENVINRAMGDLFLEDDSDLKFVGRLTVFRDENQLIDEINRLDFDLAECELPAPKPVR